MKALLLFIYLFFCVLILNAQDYLITFSGTGSSTTVETITVENLTQGKSITFSGSKTLHLMSAVTGNSPLLEYLDYPMIVYPNPTSGDFSVQFEAQKSGMVTVAIYDMSGREINHLRLNVQVGFQSFKVAGLSNGVYTIQVLLEDQNFTQKVVCNSKSTQTASISYNGFSEAKQKDAALKNATTEQAWQYNTGDRLKFQGTSGKYSTIVMDVPTQSKTLSFDFVECTDADGNNYPVVKIGNQLWMAENLKTTKYNDGTLIPTETDNLKWANLTNGAYCWQNNDINNKSSYGALYNWYAIGTNKLAPKGWHIPTNVEWTDLISFMGGEGLSGGKMKEAKTLHWASPNTGATNEVGFTALPAGVRLVDKLNSFSGNFRNFSAQSTFWSKSEIDNTYAWGKELFYTISKVNKYWTEKQSGCSVRCIKDIESISMAKFVSKAPIYTYPNNTVGQIKNNYFFPGHYVTNESAIDLYDIGGIFSMGDSHWAGSYYRFSDNMSINFDYNNDGVLDFFAFMCNFRDDPWGSKSGKYMLVKDVLSSNPEIKYIDCTTRFGGLFEVNDFNNDGINEIIQYSQDGHGLVDGSFGKESPLKIIYFQTDGNITVKEVGVPMGIHDLATGDIDGDGDVDILVWRYNTNVGDSLPLLYLNEGNGNFTLQDSYKTFSGLEELITANGQYVVLAVELFDLNNDGYLDIVSGQNIGKALPENGGPLTPNCRVYWGNSKGTFDLKNNYSDLPNTSIKDSSIPNTVLGFSFLDFDKDGDYDVLSSVTPNYGGFYLQLYENLGGKNFKDITESKIIGFSNIHPRDGGEYGDFSGFYAIGLYDIDNDGDYDIIPQRVGTWGPFPLIPNLYWENIGGSFVRRNM